MNGAWAISAGLLTLVLMGCDLAPPSAPAPEPVPDASQPPPDFRPHVGQSYTDLVTAADTERYAVANLGLEPGEQARFAQAMSLSAPAWLAEGGGATAFVVVGCQAGACAQAAAILAIDTQTGAAYAAVRDGQGRSTLLANDRLEALVEATEPANRWADPDAWADSAPAPAATP